MAWACMANGNQNGDTEQGGKVETLLESSLESVDAGEQQAIDFARAAGVSEDDLHGLGMAVREALVNAVVHGNRYNANKRVRFCLEADREQVEITIVDEGEGFDLSELPDPLAEENLLRQSGRGILLIQAFVDDFSMHRNQPQGTVVRLVKRIQPEA